MTKLFAVMSAFNDLLESVLKKALQAAEQQAAVRIIEEEYLSSEAYVSIDSMLQLEQ